MTSFLQTVANGILNVGFSVQCNLSFDVEMEKDGVSYWRKFWVMQEAFRYLITINFPAVGIFKVKILCREGYEDGSHWFRFCEFKASNDVISIREDYEYPEVSKKYWVNRCSLLAPMSRSLYRGTSNLFKIKVPITNGEKLWIHTGAENDNGYMAGFGSNRKVQSLTLDKMVSGGAPDPGLS